MSGRRQSIASNLVPAVLLAAVGGLLDAVVYLNHGHVFANAMTGNVIFLGLACASRDWGQIPPHVAPLAAFLFGVVAARLLHRLPAQRGSQLTLSLEILVLFMAGFFPASFPQVAFTATVAFVSAFQVTTFRRVGRFTYNSTFVTGNLREVAEGAFDSLFSHDPALRNVGRAKSLKLALICGCFLMGAVGGAWAAQHHAAHAIWFAEPMLIAVLCLTSVQKR